MNLSRLLLPSCVLALVLSAVSITYRIKVENRNKALTLALEIENLRADAVSAGVSLDEAAKELKHKGLGGVVLTEETVAEIASRGEIILEPGAQIAGTDNALRRVFAGLQRRFGKDAFRMAKEGEETFIVANGKTKPSMEAVRGTSVGLNPNDCLLARANGLHIIGRLANPYGVTDGYVRDTLDAAMNEGMTYYLPLGDQVLGRRDAMEALYETCRTKGLIYCSPEFGKLGGDTETIIDIPDHVVRLHSAQGAELDKLPRPEVVDRFVRAARERGQRILLIRPVSYAAPSPIGEMGKLLEDIAKECEKQGSVLGAAHPATDSEVPKILFPLIGIALAPVVAWVLTAAFGERRALACLLFTLLVGAGCYNPHVRPIAAFLAAATFPVAAFMWLRDGPPRNWLVGFAVITAITAVGGFCVAGLLNGIEYFVQAKQFEGVKLAVFGPIVVVGLMFFNFYVGGKESLKSPITWMQAVFGFVILGALGLLIARTGNDNPATVSGTELKVRALLDQFLMVRPRTKEFLVGHPLLVIGLCLKAELDAKPGLKPKLGGWTALALLGGAIGQTGMLNTFCHIHSPFVLGMIRNLIGVVLGPIIGVVLWNLLKATILKRFLVEA
ncbi:MAG: hypothetical protein JSS72_13190 [Armatimonadetes bacterium]|nr:hypothetical protein [Armatimonadota bacterium]